MHDLEGMSPFQTEAFEYQPEYTEFGGPAAEGIFEAPFELGYEGGGGEVLGEWGEQGYSGELLEEELAAELLSVSSEEELDQFLGKMFRGIGRFARGIIRNPVFRSLGGALKGIARKALPFAGAALGSVVPGVGTAIGGALGSAASRLFEVQLEGLSPEDQEFTVARRFVRLAQNAAQQAARMPDTGNPTAAARAALLSAARTHAPGLASLLGQARGGAPAGVPAPGAAVAAIPTAQCSCSGRTRSGRWYRRGARIVIVGA